ncbi:efflux RND transporter permease subunit [Cocleimonas sp. KMM 6892]|uniref:efflux RND transporter permease subunit n=1 Tax=unclassified Cocleimonas TaxID=2639732 RepID=UPI002DB58B27|nr:MULTISPECIES: efflux RND transporter permease subunit [unclassified Cocleimonas]MEB8432258.1 efflux RND transporter permease subunit [Cocleimonas sp. KMM 6892]MEC4714656.1 efflux RND transporter permease subunit [Cocleimonas sp. KMM 6895]MEC4744530.1 efflux RND transporter permease subunit [Cocleimonas sp. KMM 6896]
MNINSSDINDINNNASEPFDSTQSKGIIAWFVNNPVAANILMITIIVTGLYTGAKLITLESFPSFETDVVNISISYPGATPQEVEEGIAIRVEDAIADLPGIDKIYSDSSEGSASIRVEILSKYDVTKLLNEIKSRVDSITSFPEDAEQPVIEQQIRSRAVITVVTYQDSLDEVALRRNTEKIRDEIRGLPNITQISMGGVRPWEISINVPESTLRQYDLTLGDISNVISNASRDIPGGTIKAQSGDILVRTLGQAYKKDDFANIKVISKKNGTSIRLGDIADINDGFNEDPLYSEFDGKKAAFINISRVGDQNAIELANTVKDYIEARNKTLPPGLHLTYWQDSSKIVKARLNTLTNSLIQGIGLVLLLLALFLRPDLAFWVSVGIPISFLGALALMPQLGMTMNIISMFGFILVLGIVVDDAIVTGENIYSHLEKTGDPKRAVIEGTQEIAVPVTFGVLTTVAAFLPLLMMEGRRGPIFAQIPMVVIPVLLFSLIESKFVLPSHLRHMKLRKNKDNLNIFTRIQRSIAQSLVWFVKNIYAPFLNACLNARYLTLTVFISILIITITMVTTGRYKYTFFPRIESETVSATIEMPEGTSLEITEKYVNKMVSSVELLQKKYIEPYSDEGSESLSEPMPESSSGKTQNLSSINDSGTGTAKQGQSIIKHILVTVGSAGRRPSGSSGVANIATITFETIPPEERKLDISTIALVQEWRDLIGPIPGVKELSFRAEIGRGGEPIDVQLIGTDFNELNDVALLVKAKLGEYDGLFDIKNSYEGGKAEVQLRIKPSAEQLGLNLTTLGQQVRNSIYGAEAQRIQRNQSEIKVMVRAPKGERLSLSGLQNLKIRTPTGASVPLSEVAEVSIGKGSSTISRVDRQRIINVTADLDKDKISANAVVANFKEWFPDILANNPGVNFDMEGEQREQKESNSSLMFGFAVALIAIYILLAIPFGSYFQPIMVMSIIPFSIIGAIGGHAIMGMSLSVSSVMGLLALVGVVVNDSLVLVDYTNKKIKSGIPVAEAIRIAGQSRFRPILLTSLTTFAGLTPLILEKSTQAQFLIPMAVSLGFGILFATMLTLVLIPTFYLIVEDFKSILKRLHIIRT